MTAECMGDEQLQHNDFRHSNNCKHSSCAVLCCAVQTRNNNEVKEKKLATTRSGRTSLATTIIIRMRKVREEKFGKNKVSEQVSQHEATLAIVFGAT